MSTTKRAADEVAVEAGANGDGPTEVKRANRPAPDDDDDETDDVVEIVTGEPFVLYNIDEWLEENEEFFEPPVCNKLMHEEGQMKVFFVGGPNVRKDFHIEEGEELFFMHRGDMCLKVIEQGKHRDIEIKEGQIFLLPARIPHSPQRKAGTIGMVIERERLPEEQDGLKYFVEKDGELTTEPLYEKWFHCDDLGPQLAAIVKEYFTTEQSKTGKPIEGTISDNPPVVFDDKTKIRDPFDLKEWIEENREALENEGSVTMFGKGSQFEVTLYGEGEFSAQRDGLETFLWQLEGACDLTIDDGEPWSLEENDTMLIKAGASYSACNAEESVTLVCYQDPGRIKKST